MSERPVMDSGAADAYDLAADSWDRKLGFRSARFAGRMREIVVRLLRPAAGSPLALELGVGTGWLLDATSPLFGQLRTIESSSRMREHCLERIGALGLRNVSVEAGDATALDAIGDASVDAIYAVGLLDAVSEPQRVLSACHRVLKPNGYLVVSTANGACPWYGLRDRLLGVRQERTGRYFTESELVGAARLAGLAAVDVVTWGAAPQRMTFAPLVALFDASERVASAAGLSRYLGVLTASFQKPGTDSRM